MELGNFFISQFPNFRKMYSHIPVLLKEVIEYLNPQPGQNFVDCTLGGGGHAIEILKRVAPVGKVLGIDLDENAIEEVRRKLKTTPDPSLLSRGKAVTPDPSLARRGITVKDNFVNLRKILDENNFYPVNGILMDLGISSAEYESGRGFSFQKEEPLDMRFNATHGGNRVSASGDNAEKCGDAKFCVSTTADEIVNSWRKDELARIFREYGEEPLAEKIAGKIIDRRKSEKIDNTKKLSDLIFGEYKKVYKNKTFKRHPATKVFQALRIAVNHEIENLERVLPQSLEALEKGGRLAVISFHSIEDRIVKKFFNENAKGCICPPEIPICVCGHKPLIKILTKHPIVPNDEEIEKNPRARSAKLRVAEKL